MYIGYNHNNRLAQGSLINMDYIYVLQCNGGDGCIGHTDTFKYYVGKTRDVEKRFDEHQSGISTIKGAVWTTKYKPIKNFM